MFFKAMDLYRTVFPNPSPRKALDESVCTRGKQSTFLLVQVCRAVSAALHTPQLGWPHAGTGGPKFQSRHHLAPQIKLRFPKLKYEALEISEFRGPFERKVHDSFFGPL